MQVSVTFDVDVDRVDDIIASIAALYGYPSIGDLTAALADHQPSTTHPHPTGSVPEHPATWTSAKMERYVKQLTRNALRALRTIATHAPEVPIHLVQKEVDLAGAGYGGMMSTFGSAARNTKGITDKPFHKYGDYYIIDNATARLVIETLDRNCL